MKIAVVGAGYVGMSNAVLLAQKHEVMVLDVRQDKVASINEKKTPVKDKMLEEYLQTKDLNLRATLDPRKAYVGADFILIATPTNYDARQNYFDMGAVEQIAEEALRIEPDALIVIKSTIPVGYTMKLREKVKSDNIVFSPEFLRENNALMDNLYPSRIVVGERSKRGERLANLLADCAIKENIPILLTGSSEAEAIKLFANTFLALRVAYFNEMDTYGELQGLDSKELIRGVSLDPRIGDYYNNPSFGYGGYCLPKDTKQLLSEYERIPEKLITAVVDSNQTRKEHIVSMILSRKPEKVGIYRLNMKKGSDNFRQSAIMDVMSRINARGVDIAVYEPQFQGDDLGPYQVIKDLEKFKKISDIIVVNRISDELADVREKIYSRDLFNRD